MGEGSETLEGMSEMDETDEVVCPYETRCIDCIYYDAWCGFAKRKIRQHGRNKPTSDREPHHAR
jgi:hypothetical protein